MVSFRVGEKRSIDTAGNAASWHKMFIAAESDFSGGKVWGGEKRGADETKVQKREPPLEWSAARVLDYQIVDSVMANLPSP